MRGGDSGALPVPRSRMPELPGASCSGQSRNTSDVSLWSQGQYLCVPEGSGYPHRVSSPSLVRGQAVMFTVALSELGLGSFPPTPLAPLIGSAQLLNPRISLALP